MAENNELNEGAVAIDPGQGEGAPLTLPQEVIHYIANENAKLAGEILSRVDERIDEAHRAFDERFAALELEFSNLDPAAVAEQVAALAKVASDMEASGLSEIAERVRTLEDRVKHFV